MTDTSGPTSPTPFAYYDPDESCWKTSQGTFPWDSATYSATWPRSGMTRGGAAFELPTPAPLTDGSACSSLLATPAAQEPGGTVEAHLQRKNRHDGANRTKPSHLSLQVTQLLPTPAASNLYGDMEVEDFEALRERWKAKHGNGNGHGTPLGIAVKSLPTPTAMDSAGSRNSTARRRPNSTGNPGDTLTDAVWKQHGAPPWAKTNLLSIGVSTPPPSPDGNTPSADPHPTPPTPPDDSTPDLWNG